MDSAKTKRQAREHRHARVRRRVRGTAERPRLSVYRSNTGIYAQVIDDDEGRTLVAASTLETETGTGGSKTDGARAVGALVAQRAQEVGVAQVAFDRGGNRYQGRVRALAEAARDAGLRF